jgi:hypothetical protein
MNLQKCRRMIESLIGHLKTLGSTTDAGVAQAEAFREKLLNTIDRVIRKNPQDFPTDCYYEEEVDNESNIEEEEREHDVDEQQQDDDDEQESHVLLYVSVPL